MQNVLSQSIDRRSEAMGGSTQGVEDGKVFHKIILDNTQP